MYTDFIDEETKEDLVDYFYYAQLRTQGEDTTEERKITGTVPLKEIPNLVRALGYYPTELECANMIAEVYYSNFTETGETNDVIDLETFTKLFINHKPVFGTSKAEIESAFKEIGGAVHWSSLVALLEGQSEAISKEDLANILQTLSLGEESKKYGLDPASAALIDASAFSDKILGFDEDVREPVDASYQEIVE